VSDSKASVWVVEDDPKIAALVVEYLVHAGFATDAIGDGAVALERLRARQPALVVLDLMLPGLDGVSVCRELRRFSAVPVIMLTARIDEVDRLQGLDVGADDYVCKPFSPNELIGRVKAQLRRASGQVLQAASPWSIDDATLKVRWRGNVLPLTPLEFRLLRALLQQPDRVFSRQQLLDSAHDDFRDVSDRAIDSHVKNLRRKLSAVSPAADRIATVYGVGYRLKED
jgi:two-component system, OmpR family, response regulator BaeR